MRFPFLGRPQGLLLQFMLGFPIEPVLEVSGGVKVKL